MLLFRFIVTSLQRDQKHSALKLAAAGEENHTSHHNVAVCLHRFAAASWATFQMVVFKDFFFFSLSENVDFFQYGGWKGQGWNRS